MKILVLVDSYPPHHGGGYELRCKDVVTGLTGIGHDVKIITTRCPSNPCAAHPHEANIMRVLHKKSQSTSLLDQIRHDIRDTRYIERATRSFRPDVVYFWHLGDLSNAILPFFSKLDIPMVYDEGGKGLSFANRMLKRGPYFYQNEKDSVLKKAAKRAINSFAGLVSRNRIHTSTAWPEKMLLLFNSRASVEYARQNGVPVSNAKVIYSGVDTQRFRYKPRNGLTPPIRIIVPGRITPIKGTLDSLALFNKLREESIPAVLTIIGNDFSKPYFAEVKHKVEEMGCGDELILMPMTDHEELVRHYHENDICFFPSYQEWGLSRVPLEAMACGCLVITYGNEGSNEIIENGKTGYIVDHRKLNSAVDIIKNLLTDSAEYMMIRESARSAVVNNHSLLQHINKIEDFLESTINADRDN